MAYNFGMRRSMAATSSWAALGLAIAFGAPAQAQLPTQTNAPVIDLNRNTTTAEEIVVVGARASQQSAINRKKNAATATDSIVADDIGSFPDRNVNEALSRIPGVALNRNDFGEGDGIAVRGNGPDLTRVELDGLGVQSTNAADSESRGADLRELPAELIKSVDVVKGSTADLTEGSLGGSVLIKTRTGLDFKKPFFSVRGGAQMNTLGKKWTPDFNAVASRKFFDDRLGVIVTGSYTNIQLDGHNAENTTSNARNYNRIFDFDNSPEKTFAFNPDTLSDDIASDTVFNTSTTETPRSLVTKSAGAQSKAECLVLFPNNPLGNNAQKNQRIVEQQTCLNQWNDSTPSLLRQFQNTQEDERYSIDARIDYQLTDDFVVYAKFNQSNRKTDEQSRQRNTANGVGTNAGGPIQFNVPGTFIDTTTAAPYPRLRTVNPNGPAGYYLYNTDFGLNAVGNNAVLGNVLNVVPGSVEVDAAHNVTKFTTTNNVTNINQSSNVLDVKTQYVLLGGDYVGERLEINFLAGRTKAYTSREDVSAGRTSFYGDATLSIQSNGLWGLDLPEDYDISSPDQFVQLQAPVCITANPAVIPPLPNTRPNCRGRNPINASVNNPADLNAYTVGQLPLTTPGFGVNFSGFLAENSETQAKTDFAYRTDGLLPLIARVKVGAMYRDNRNKRWGGGGYEAKTAIGTFGQPGYEAPIVVPRTQVRGFLQACENTAGSLAPGGLPCAYGFTQSTNLSSIREGTDVLTPDQLKDLFARTLEPAAGQYFGDLPNRGNLPDNWDGIRARDLLRELGNYQFMNLDCTKECTANDGQVYAQPVNETRETVKNIYFMTDLEQDLFFGTRFTGNVGIRGVHTRVQGTGFLALNTTSVTAAFDPLQPTLAAGIRVQTLRQNVSITKSSMDWLPTFNGNLWGFNDKLVGRYYGGKTVARPPINRLAPAGTCEIDERFAILPELEDDQGCSGRIGNPALKPYTAWNHNLSLEWYPNRDTSIAIAYHYLDVKIGAPINDTAEGNLFAGSDLIDPVSGRPASELVFAYPTYVNGPGFKRRGWEFTAKTAFTFLPWFLKYTGVDFNISTLKSQVKEGIRDPLTGETQLPPNESKYYTNMSLWYDDGKLNLRVAYQDRTSRFSCITPCGGNNVDINYPGEGYSNVRLVGPGYNPGVPRFLDGSTFIDAKASYNVTKSFQVYVEGRNLRREAQTISLGKYLPFEDGTRKLLKLSYGGMRVLTGAKFQFGQR